MAPHTEKTHTALLIDVAICVFCRLHLLPVFFGRNLRLVDLKCSLARFFTIFGKGRRLLVLYSLGFLAKWLCPCARQTLVNDVGSLPLWPVCGRVSALVSALANRYAFAHGEVFLESGLCVFTGSQPTLERLASPAARVTILLNTQKH